ncbi:hypothetical protein GGTG_00185 [Gaeumannomyces tritici R3-111a-1]|uniref:RING-type domain-containing protein n=1 Tax=Gaeumannomyces tritici (strain R3-111a-1) TaxID=644352 RepID=J3NFZ2_GAET3|nr:hypothetical protein GGTG_00185 [Gaeumannomyces tritici R3-111a-1]EJT80182.1 hypothetical protein GGTG_00185 [Gaeumannomyces tritici R3-111a-1]
MSSASNSLGKSLSAPTANAHPPAAAAPSTAAPSFDSSRRPLQGPSSQPAPRKSQGSRRQHRNQRRPFKSEAPDLDDDAMAELSAVRNPTNRRGQTSITHLLNYSSLHRPYAETHGHGYGSSSRGAYRRNPTWGIGSGHHAADKARYVHANYRFVVSPRGDYRKQAADADEHLDWADVLQVLASSQSQAGTCPICLSEPVAPRMAKCGHIFCLPCLIRFMHSSSDDEDRPRGGGPGMDRRQRWKKCPICEDSIYISEVRPVRFYAGQESPMPRPGDDVVLRLMVRKARSTLALPKETGVDILNVGQDVPWHFAANILDYARIIKGTGDYMMEQHGEEIQAIKLQEKEDELMFHEDNEWTQRAIKSILAAKQKLQELEGLGVSLPPTGNGKTEPQAEGPEPEFYFYTCQPHLYLSPLDIRILKTQYGDFSSFPSALLPRVEHIVSTSVDDLTRKRAKYLYHLPYGCEISFLECDWTDIVPAEILVLFADEIERRRKRNRDKEAQEERERQQAERLEAAAMRGARRTVMMPATEEEVRIRFGGGDRAVNPDDFIPLGGTTPPNPRNGFSELAGMSTSPSAPRTVWGTPAAVPPTADAAAEVVARRQVMTNVDDGWLKDDAFLESLSAADIAAQMEALGVEDAGVGGSTPLVASNGGGGNAGSGGGKKKKKQKITLMSTGGRRGN